MIILGAGLSGLICGALNAQAHIHEQNRSDVVSHKAVLRFRDDKIARALGLSFRRVTVRKAIWSNAEEAAPTPRLANQYSLKVRGIIGDASIWNMATTERFIAPEDLHAVLADLCGDRVHWNSVVTTTILNELIEQGPIISTIPIPNLLSTLDIAEPFAFRYAPIFVDRYHVSDCDVFQTVYYPDAQFNVYRATLTGKLLTIESVAPIVDDETDEVIYSLGIDSRVEVEPVGANHRQSFGKISPVDPGLRKALLHRLTERYGIYSLGRFATWRNILLDDVFEDIAAIRRMMTHTQYDMALERSK